METNGSTITVGIQKKALLDYVSGPEAAVISKWIMRVHDMALYNNTEDLGEEDKIALLAMKKLAEKILLCI